MTLSEGDEIRTLVRSAVKFVIPPDQAVTIDRLSVVQLVRANFENGRFKTDIGQKYGRTQFEVEAAGREHDVTVRSPSSVLAVRGTRFVAYDQPPFTPEAVSLEGRVMFRDVRRQVSLGTRGQAAVNRLRADRDSPAQTALADASVNPRAAASGGAESDNEDQLALATTNFLQNPQYQVGVFEIFGQANSQAILDSLSVIGTVPGELASFELSFVGSPQGNVDLSILTPFGDVITPLNTPDNRSPSGGVYIANFNADDTGNGGFDQVIYDDAFQPAPEGVYTITSTLVTGTQATTSLTVLTDKLSSNPGVFGPINQNLSSGSPSATVQVNLLRPTPTRPDVPSDVIGRKRKRR
jgi:hypothetical protein